MYKTGILNDLDLVQWSWF